MFTTTLYPMNFDKKNNLTQSIRCIFDDAELTIIAEPAQGIGRGWFLPPNTYDCGSFVVN